jgi:aryl-alcohol dehydrogenase-like predicted oxidoreductase
MQKISLGPWRVSNIGLGCMNFTIPGGVGLTDPELGIKAIHDAINAGIDFLDTADIYAPSWDDFGRNEKFVAEALSSYSGKTNNLVVATKGGITRRPGEEFGRNGSVDYLLRAAEASCYRLGVQKIQLWQHHRLDPSMEFETQVENLMSLKEAGFVEHLGVSNYNADQLTKAIEITGGEIISVQNQFNPYYRQDLEVLSVCLANDIAFLPWSPFGGSGRAKDAETTKAFEKLASELQISSHAAVIAWLLTIPGCVPIPGATKSENIKDLVAASEIELTEDQKLAIAEALPESEDLHWELIDQPAFRE